MEKEELVSWEKIGVLKEFDFDTLCKRRTELSELKAKIEPELKQINDELAVALRVADVKSVQWHNLRVTQVNGKSASQLSSKKLLEFGVDPQIIADSTIPGKEYTTVQFKEIKGEVSTES